MRITFILPTVNMSGGIRVIAIYAKALVDRGHHVTLISQPPHRPFRYKVRSLLMGRGWPTAPSSNSSHLDELGLQHHVMEKFRRPIDDDVPDADVVIATFWYTAKWVNNLCDSKGCKVYFIQGYETIFSKKAEASYKLPLHKIVIAKWIQRVMREQYGDIESQVVPNAVDQTLFFSDSRNKQPRPTVGFLYSPLALKGVDVTLKAIEQLHSTYTDLRVICFGTSQPNNNFDIELNIEFLYSPPQEKLRELYASCDVWMTASISEGFNLPAMEAMACRTPVVSTKTGWPEDAIIDGQNGYLVDVNDSVALATATSRILSMPNEDWISMSEQSYKTVENSSWKTSVDLFERALEKIVQNDHLK